MVWLTWALEDGQNLKMGEEEGGRGEKDDTSGALQRELVCMNIMGVQDEM